MNTSHQLQQHDSDMGKEYILIYDSDEVRSNHIKMNDKISPDYPIFYSARCDVSVAVRL